MEAAQSTVKKILNNESGNIIVVVGLIGMIAGGLYYWSNLASKVDNEVRSLGATQSTTYMRADFKTSIRKSIQGTNTFCAGLAPTFESKFKNYLTSAADASYNVNYQDNPSTPGNEVSDVTLNPNVRCFFNPGRYTGLKWESLKISIKRTTDPNYMTLSNFIAADVQAVFRVSGKPTILKYQLKYRIDILSLNHFGTIFMNAHSGPVMDLDSQSKLLMRSSVLFDTPNRNLPFPVSNLMLLPDDGRLHYLKETFTSIKSFSSDSSIIDFLTTNTLSGVFKKGIEYGQLSTDASFKAPYELSADQWNDLIDMTPTGSDGYPLPQTPIKSAIFNTITNTASREYEGFNVATDEIYSRMSGSPGPKKLTKSCGTVSDLSLGVYNLFIFNNLTKDLTIDFTGNIETDFPPVFCGVMAVRNLIVKLNNQDATGAFHKHHILGKLIVNGKIKVINEGELHIHDLMDFTESDIEYVLPDPLNITNIRTQYFNQKYYSTQNFFLPFFKPGQNLSVPSANLMNDNNRFYVPRGTTAFFKDLCSAVGPAYTCRVGDIGAPTKEHLPETHWQKLMFEVFNVE